MATFGGSVMRARSLLLLVNLALVACGASSSADEDDAASAEGALTEVSPRVADSPALWDARCEGTPLDEARARALLGGAATRVIGRFRLAVRLPCYAPDVPGCTAERQAVPLNYRPGLAPTRAERIARSYWRAPLYVPDEGDVVLRSVRGRPTVRLVGDPSMTMVAEDDGRNVPLHGRIISHDLLQIVPGSTKVNLAIGTARSAPGVAAERFETLDFDTPASRERGVRDLGVLQEQWSEDIGSYFGHVTLTDRCLRIVYRNSVAPDRFVRADFVRLAP